MPTGAGDPIDPAAFPGAPPDPTPARARLSAVVGVLALQGAFACAPAAARRPGRRRLARADPVGPRRRRRPGTAGRREHDDVDAARHERAVRPVAETDRGRHAGVRHVCRHDPVCHPGARRAARPARIRSPRRHGATQRLRPPTRQLRGRHRRGRARRAVPRRVHQGAAGRPRRRRGRGPRRARRRACSAA